VIKIICYDYAFIIKYNYIKEKEFSSFDCDKEAMIFFDRDQNEFIFDTDTIIDMTSGLPLYYYQTGLFNF
jgi:hypothetical protein